MRFKDQRIGIFIDVQNLYHSAKNLYDSKVNYAELVKNLTANRHLIRALGYVVKSETQAGEETPGEASFFEALEKAGIDLRVKELQVFSSGMKKADWDVGMAVDAVRMADALDVIILVTGDGDFLPLLDYLKWGRGRIVEVAGFGRNAAIRLKESADLFVDIAEIPKVLIKK